MAFPLVVNPRSVGVEVRNGDLGTAADAMVMSVDLTVTRTTRFGMLFRHARTVTIEGITDPAFLPRSIDMSATLSHTFAGVGPGRYIPSFPQWDRQQTTYPFAY